MGKKMYSTPSRQQNSKDLEIKMAELMSRSEKAFGEAEEALNKKSNKNSANAVAKFKREKAARSED